MEQYKNVVFIPVRGGSKSIPLKNIKEICGKPLVCWTVEASAKCKSIDKVYVATDSQAIKSTVENFFANSEFKDKIECIERSEETATDTASTESAMLEFSQNYNFENIVLVQATSPLLRSEDIQNGYNKFVNDKLDSLLSVVGQKRFIWEENEDGAKSVNYDYNNRPRRQDFDAFLVENGAFYITSKKALDSSKCRISGEIGTYEMHESTFFEIDEPTDWIIIENLMKKLSFDKTSEKPKVKIFVTDCDGVMTDGGMYYAESGDELKKFNTKDGMGMALLKSKGIKTAIITGEDTRIVANRACKLKFDYVFQGIGNKIEVLKTIAEIENVSFSEIAYIGDDINDLECIASAGIGFTVADAMDSVKQTADIILKSRGGQGALREATEYILQNL